MNESDRDVASEIVSRRPRLLGKKCDRRHATRKTAVTMSVFGLAAALSVIPAIGQLRGACVDTVIVGELTRGEPFEQRFGEDLVFRLHPQTEARNPQGWTIRISPTQHPEREYSMVATPPYRFSNPRYIDTAYGITAEAALAWTPRVFRYVANEADYRIGYEAVSVLLWSGNHLKDEIERARTDLEELRTYEGRVWIEDRSASSPDSANTLGTIDWMRFRAELCVPSL